MYFLASNCFMHLLPMNFFVSRICCATVHQAFLCHRSHDTLLAHIEGHVLIGES